MTATILSTAVLYLSAFLFCLVIGVFIVPLLLERIIYYIPRLNLLVREGALFRRSMVVNVGAILGWASVVTAIYIFLYNVFPPVFALVTTSPFAWVAWVIGFLHLVYRALYFGRTVKREFYYSTYMHYITPEALHAYEVFIERLEDMSNTELKEQAALGKAIPYMHRQALQRKMGERGILDSWTTANRKISLLSLLRPGKYLGQ